MALFDTKNFNGEVFGAYVDRVPNLNRRNELLKSGAIVEKNQYASMLPDQTGGDYITIPIKARIGGEADNYDGSTDITTDSRDTYTQNGMCIEILHIGSFDEEPASFEKMKQYAEINNLQYVKNNHTEKYI